MHSRQRSRHAHPAPSLRHAGGHFPRACDSLHTLVSQDGHCRTRQARHVALRGGCLRAGAVVIPQVVVRRGSCGSAGSVLASSHAPNNQLSSCERPVQHAGIQHPKPPHTLETAEAASQPTGSHPTLGGRPKARSRSCVSLTPKASRSASYSSTCGGRAAAGGSEQHAKSQEVWTAQHLLRGEVQWAGTGCCSCSGGTRRQAAARVCCTSQRSLPRPAKQCDPAPAHCAAARAR